MRTKYLTRPKPGLIYFRHGGKSTRLPSDEASPEFAAAYDALLAAIDKTRRPGRPSNYLKTNARPLIRGQKKFQPPSIGWFIEQWLQSDFFAQPDKPRPKDKPFRPGTQYNYRLGIELLRQIKGTDGTQHGRIAARSADTAAWPISTSRRSSASGPDQRR